MKSKIIAISGAHGSGKTSALEELKRQNHPGIYVDEYKVSRTVLQFLGLTLEEATATPELTQRYQNLVLEWKIDHDQVLSQKLSIPYCDDERIGFVDRSLADIYAYTRLWCEKNNIDKSWFNAFEKKCIEEINKLYKKVLLVPIGKFPFIDDGIRAKEETQKIIAEYIETFIRTYCNDYVIIEPVSIVDRANLFAKIGKE